MQQWVLHERLGEVLWKELPWEGSSVLHPEGPVEEQWLDQQVGAGSKDFPRGQLQLGQLFYKQSGQVH